MALSSSKDIYQQFCNVGCLGYESSSYKSYWTCWNDGCYRLPKGVLTASCEAELQELMKQIDIMMATKKKDWEHQIQSLQSKVELRDKESLLQKSTIDQKHKEVRTPRTLATLVAFRICLNCLLAVRSNWGWKSYLLTIFKCFNASNSEFSSLYRILFIVLKILGLNKWKI